MAQTTPVSIATAESSMSIEAGVPGGKEKESQTWGGHDDGRTRQEMVWIYYDLQMSPQRFILCGLLWHLSGSQRSSLRRSDLSQKEVCIFKETARNCLKTTKFIAENMENVSKSDLSSPVNFSSLVSKFKATR